MTPEREIERQRLVVVVAFLNENAFLPRFLASVERQTRLPDQLVLVDDGSSDGSADYAEGFAKSHGYAVFHRRPPRPVETDRLATAAELKAFQWAVEQLDVPWDVLAKLDADLELNPQHFERLLDAFEFDAQLGMVGAQLADVLGDGSEVRQPAPAWHVRGATKFYRRACYEQIQPIPAHLGWDMIDEVRARAAGWKTTSVELPVRDSLHLRPTGGHNGMRRAYVRWGECAWGYGAHPLFVILGGIKRIPSKPYGIGGFLYVLGFVRSSIRRTPRASGATRSAVRTEEWRQVRSLGRMRRATTRRERIVHLACSPGGHLDLLLRLRGSLDGMQVVWVTQRSQRAEVLRRQGEEVHILGDYHREALRIRPFSARRFWTLPRGVAATAAFVLKSTFLVARQRPSLVVTTGAGIVVPYCILARLLGAEVIFIETAAHVTEPSSSGRVLGRVAQEVVVQWAEMAAVYPRAAIAKASVLEGVSTAPREGVEGTFVGVGTHSQPFDRLVSLADRSIGAGVLPQPAYVQRGTSTVSVVHAESQPFIQPEEMAAKIRSARYVVCHAGTGTISASLRAGIRPLVLPRLASRGEHYDDHQLQILEKLTSLNLVVPLDGEIGSEHLRESDRPLVLPDEIRSLPSLHDCLHRRIRIVNGDARATPADPLHQRPVED